MSIPSELGERFKVGDELVKRPNCIIHKATDESLGGREVAIKLFVDHPTEESTNGEFEKEVDSLRKVSHPSLVPILAGGQEGDWLYLAMELIEGPTLRDTLKKEDGPLELSEATKIFKEIAEGVAEIHESGEIHGHIDSRAVIFKGNNARLAGYYPKIIQTIQKNVTTQGRLIVDPAYVAPEQVSDSGTVDARADIYALAVLLYEMVTGERPFTSSNPLQLAMERLTKNPPSPKKKNPAISTLLDAAILKGLAKSPDDRFSNVSDFIDAVTGGKKEPINPLSEIAPSSESAERLGAGETVGVSMSTDAIKDILKSHEEREDKESTGKHSTPEALDVDSTMMGMPTAHVLSGNIIFMSGKRRGEKIQLDKEQSIIGSASNCAISVTDEGVPARAVIIIKRDGDYYAAPLAADSLTINGDSVEGTEEQRLKRSDVLTVGETELRYIAPGEVFTLRDEVADRKIDRKDRRGSKPLKIALAVLALVGVVVLYSFSSSVSDKQAMARKQKNQKDQQKAELIAKLRKEGDQFFKAGQLIGPVGENARKRFEQILEVNPDDTYAKRRLAEIKSRSRELEAKRQEQAMFAKKVDELLVSADRYFQSQNFIAPPGQNARDTYREVLRIDSENEVAKARLEEINKLLGNILGRIETLLAKAKVYMELGQYVVPKGENAYDLVSNVLKLDPQNDEAFYMVYDMAAQSVFEGDQARAAANHKQMKKSYLTAQLLGVNPAFLQPKLKGAELIKKSSSAVIIYDRKDEEKAGSELNDSGYLNTSEVKRRIAELSLKAKAIGTSKEQRFFDLTE